MKRFREAGARAVVAGIVVSSLSAPTYAGYSQPGYVQNLTIESDYVVFDTSVTHSSPPECHSPGNPRGWAFPVASVGAQAKLAALLSAQGRNKRVAITGSSTCERPGYELAYIVRLED